MSVDLYQPCPGGLDKKIKFCCKDLAHELDKISRLVKADQDKAALEFVERLVEKYPDRQCLLAWNARLRIALCPPEEARPAVDRFLQQAPENPLAHCSLAVVEARTIEDEPDAAAEGQSGDTSMSSGAEATPPTLSPQLSESCRRAMSSIQKTLECVTKLIPGHLASALVMIGRRLFMEGFPIAGREHLSLALTLQGSHPQALGRNDLIESYQTREYPLLLKDSTVIPRIPGHVAWRAEYLAASQEVTRGRWRQGLKRFKELDGRYPNQPAINLAIANLHLRLAENRDAVARLRAFTKLEGVSETDAVYTEALALALDPTVESHTVNVVRLSFPVHNAERLAELLLGSKSTMPLGVDSREFEAEGELPPRNAFTLLDRPMPDTIQGLNPEDVPLVLGESYLFGKETDRESRVEVDTHSDWRKDKVLELFGQFSEVIEVGAVQEEVLEVIPRVYAMFALDWRVPYDANADDMERISASKQRRLVLEEWPDMPSDYLDGRTPRDAATDPAYRIRVLALILNIEAGYLRYLTLEDYDELYRRLQLPVPQPKSIFIDDLANSPAVRLARVDPAPLSDTALESAFHHAVTVMAPHAIRRFGVEIVRRGKLNDAPVNEERVYSQLATHAETTTAAVELLAQAAEAARKAGRSPVGHLLAEVDLRIRRREPGEMQRICDRIVRHHSKEPGVIDALQRLLGRHGNGIRRRSAVMGLKVPESSERAVWTPDASAEANSGEPSKIWLPGEA